MLLIAFVIFVASIILMIMPKSMLFKIIGVIFFIISVLIAYSLIIG